MKRKPKQRSTLRKKWRVSTIRLYFREILNYFYIGRMIKRERGTETWNRFRFRADWVNRIYTVINLQEQYIGEEDSSKYLRVIEEVKPMNEYINSLDMAEIVYPVIQKVDDWAYLIAYVPLFNKFTILRTLWYLVLFTGLIFAIIYGIKYFPYLINLFA